MVASPWPNTRTASKGYWIERITRYELSLPSGGSTHYAQDAYHSTGGAVSYEEGGTRSTNSMHDEANG
jgi:hypothetical protein